MVNFTQSINNGDMVRTLNTLIHRNMDLAASYDQDLDGAFDNRGYIEYIQELKALHERHAKLIGDTVQILGGAPDYSEDRYRWVNKTKLWFSKFRKDVALLKAVAAEEEKLRSQYDECRQALNGSPESVDVINQALDELEAPMRRVHEAIEKESAETS